MRTGLGRIGGMLGRREVVVDGGGGDHGSTLGVGSGS